MHAAALISALQGAPSPGAAPTAPEGSAPTGFEAALAAALGASGASTLESAGAAPSAVQPGAEGAAPLFVSTAAPLILVDADALISLRAPATAPPPYASVAAPATVKGSEPATMGQKAVVAPASTRTETSVAVEGSSQPPAAAAAQADALKVQPADEDGLASPTTCRLAEDPVTLEGGTAPAIASAPVLGGAASPPSPTVFVPVSSPQTNSPQTNTTGAVSSQAAPGAAPAAEGAPKLPSASARSAASLPQPASEPLLPTASAAALALDSTVADASALASASASSTPTSASADSAVPTSVAVASSGSVMLQTGGQAQAGTPDAAPRQDGLAASLSAVGMPATPGGSEPVRNPGAPAPAQSAAPAAPPAAPAALAAVLTSPAVISVTGERAAPSPVPADRRSDGSKPTAAKTGASGAEGSVASPTSTSTSTAVLVGRSAVSTDSAQHGGDPAGAHGSVASTEVPVLEAAEAAMEPGSHEPGAGEATHASAAPQEIRAAAAAVRGSPETVASLAAEIARKLESRNSRFEIALDPLGLGVVNVSVDIGADGRVTAHMAFERPEAAAELRGRSGELQRALEQAGFDLSKGGLSFEHGSGRERPGQDQPQGRQARAQAFQAALLTADSADTLPALPLRLRDRAGLDVRI